MPPRPPTSEVMREASSRRISLARAPRSVASPLGRCPTTSMGSDLGPRRLLDNDEAIAIRIAEDEHRRDTAAPVQEILDLDARGLQEGMIGGRVIGRRPNAGVDPWCLAVAAVRERKGRRGSSRADFDPSVGSEGDVHLLREPELLDVELDR